MRYFEKQSKRKIYSDYTPEEEYKMRKEESTNKWNRIEEEYRGVKPKSEVPVVQQPYTPKKGTFKIRAGLIGLGTGLGAGVGTMFNSENSYTGTLVGAGVGGVGTAIATGGPDNKIIARGMSLLSKLKKG